MEKEDYCRALFQQRAKFISARKHAQESVADMDQAIKLADVLIADADCKEENSITK